MRQLLTTVRRVPLRALLLGGVAVVAMASALLLRETGALDGLERSTIDARYGVRGARDPGRVVIVGLDQKSISRFRAGSQIPRSYYARLLDRLHSAKPTLIAVDVQFLRVTKDDPALLAAIARDGPVLLPTHDSANGPLVVPGGQRDAAGVKTGSAAIEQDADGIVRRMLYAPVALPTFAVRAAEMLEGKTVSQTNFPDNHAWIDYRGPPGTFPAYSMVDVLDGRVPSRAFAGRPVLVGVTDPVAKDVYSTPISSDPMAGVEVQANALTTILNGFPLQQAGGLGNFLLLLICAAFPALLGLRLPALAVFGASLVGAAVFLALAQLSFDAGQIFDVAAPAFALLVAGTGTIATDAYIERRQRMALEEAIGPLLPPRRPAAFFISYRRDQSSWPAAALAKAIAKKFGPQAAFLDTEVLAPGAKWPERIERAIRGCSVMLVLIGPYWLVRDEAGRRRLDDPDDWVRREIVAGLQRSDIPVIPVLLDAAEMPSEDDLPEPLKPLASRQAVALSAVESDESIERLIAAIRVGQPTELGDTAVVSSS